MSNPKNPNPPQNTSSSSGPTVRVKKGEQDPTVRVKKGEHGARWNKPIMLNRCQKDPVISTLQAMFNANVVRVPEARIQPLSLIGRQHRSARFLGDIRHVLTPADTFVSPKIETSPMASLSGKESNGVDFSVGVSILEGFVGFQGAPAVSLEAHFQNAREVVFQFDNVVRYYVPLTILGGLFKDVRMDQANPAVAPFFEDTHCYIIDSIITSTEFHFGSSRKASRGITIDFDGIKDAVRVNPSIRVNRESDTRVSFSGEQPLPFAFTCVHAILDPEGRIVSFAPEEDVVVLKGTAHRAKDDSAHVSVRPALQLIEWD